jgi:hypothetical protein
MELSTLIEKLIQLERATARESPAIHDPVLEIEQCAFRLQVEKVQETRKSHGHVYGESWATS